MTGLRGALAAAVIAGGLLLGTVACDNSSTADSPTTAVDGAPVSGPTSLPATAPASATAASNAKDKAFVEKMRAAGLVATDEIMLGAAQNVCVALQEKTDAAYEKSTLTPLIAGMLGTSRAKDGVSAEQATKAANADAAKLVAEAKASYCKK